jgi:hypothetical protein
MARFEKALSRPRVIQIPFNNDLNFRDGEINSNSLCVPKTSIIRRNRTGVPLDLALAAEWFQKSHGGATATAIINPKHFCAGYCSATISFISLLYPTLIFTFIESLVDECRMKGRIHYFHMEDGQTSQHITSHHITKSSSPVWSAKNCEIFEGAPDIAT